MTTNDVPAVNPMLDRNRHPLPLAPFDFEDLVKGYLECVFRKEDDKGGLQSKNEWLGLAVGLSLQYMSAGLIDADRLIRVADRVYRERREVRWRRRPPHNAPQHKADEAKMSAEEFLDRLRRY